MRKRLLAALYVLLALFLGNPRLAAASPSRKVTFQVTLSDGKTYPVAGFLYHQAGRPYRALQVLIHGASYDHRYWDFPEVNDTDYSYAEYMAERGYTVLALDTLGAGHSGRPDGDFLDLKETASGLHQVLASLRGKNPIGHGFRDVVLVGHSAGSLISVFTQAVYGDADALVVTGFSNVPHVPPVDPAVINAVLAVPYPTFPAAVRTALFYNPADSDPDVVALDNAHFSSTLSRSQLLAVLAAFGDPTVSRSTLVKVPVLVQLGEADVLYPASLAPMEAAYYPAAASLKIETLHDLGHAFNLHYGNRVGWHHIERWIDETID